MARIKEIRKVENYMSSKGRTSKEKKKNISTM